MRFFSRFALLALVFAAILALALGIAVLMRNELVAGLIIRELASRGTNAELQVSNLTWNEIEIRDLAVEELRVAQMHLTYSIAELLNGQVRTANIDGLALRIDFTGDAPPLEGLQRLAAEFGAPNQTEATPADPLPPLPIVAIDNAQISVLLPEREILFALLGGLQPNDAGGDIQLSFEARSDPFLASGDLDLLLEGAAISSLSVEANLSDLARAMRFTVNALSVPLDMDRPELQLSVAGEGEVNALAAHLPEDIAQHFIGGSFQAQLEGTVAVPLQAQSYIGAAQSELSFALALNELSLANPGNLPDWMLDRIDAAFSGSATLQNAALEGTLSADVEYAEHPARLAFSTSDARAVLSDDYSLRSADLNAFEAEVTNIPTPYASLDAVALEGSLGDLLSGATGSLQIQAAARDVNLAALSAEGATVRGRAELAPSPEGYQLSLAAPAQISLSELSLPTLIPIEALDGQVLFANLDLNTRGEEISFSQSARVRLPQLSLEVERQDGAPLLVQIESGPIDVASSGTPTGSVRFEAAANLAAIEIPELSYLVQSTALTVEGIVGGEVNARLHGGTVSHNAESPFHVALTPDLSLVQNGNAVSFAGDLRGPDDILVVAIEGMHDLASGAGDMRVHVDELSFGPGQTPANSVSRLLASLQNLRGRVEGEASFAWREGNIDTNGRFNAEQISFRQNGMTIEDLETELNFDSLLPARSSPSQHLTIRRIDTGFEDVNMLDLRYRLDTREDGTPRIHTETLSMNILGGRIFAEGGTIDPTLGESDIPLQAENLDLALLLAHIGLEELTGEGQLNGTIPVRISADGAAVELAALQADSAGLVAYRSPRAREALASGGDAVNLMLDALEDFHYDSLTLTLSKPVAGDTEIVLRMEGRNPTLLEGHPFDINISLTGDADPLLQALLAGQQLSNELLRSITGQ